MPNFEPPIVIQSLLRHARISIRKYLLDQIRRAPIGKPDETPLHANSQLKLHKEYFPHRSTQLDLPQNLSREARVLAPKVALSREELYEKVWSIPMQKLAVEFGSSDRGFAELCRRHQIPVPPRGYWARLHVGQSVKRIPLPAVGQANLGTIETDFCERQPAVEGTSTEGYGVPTIVVGHDRIISHPMILLIENGHFAEVSSESEAFRLRSPGGSLTIEVYSQ
jgi:hypothetical protein